MSGNADKYLLGLKKCFLTHMRAEHERIGAPRQDFKWLPLRLKPRGTPDEAWVEVPPTIRSFQDIQQVIQQLSPTPETFSVMEQFGYKSEQELFVDKTNLFAFLLGVTLGDAGKPVKGDSRFPSMALSLTLSKNKPNSLRFGEFTALSAHTSLGLTMHRIRDAPSSQQRYTRAECYRWITPATPLFVWVFRVCLGLERGEKTTYDPVKMDWIVDSPKSFKVHFLQGLAESDGYVDAGRDKAVIASSPNERVLSKLLESLGVPCKVYNQPPITRIEIDTTLGLALPIFSESHGNGKTLPSQRSSTHIIPYSHRTNHCHKQQLHSSVPKNRQDYRIQNQFSHCQEVLPERLRTTQSSPSLFFFPVGVFKAGKHNQTRRHEFAG